MGIVQSKVDAGHFWNHDGSEKDIDWFNEPVPRHMYDTAIEEICKKNNVRKSNRQSGQDVKFVQVGEATD